MSYLKSPAEDSPQSKSQGKQDHEYDVTLSFAGEDREYVQKVAEILRSRGIRVFYDEFFEAELWGKDLYRHFDDIYRNAARFCVIFISKHYAKKVWTDHELASAQARAIEANEEYILPAKFDDTDVPGLRPTIKYINLSVVEPEKFADLIIAKIGIRQRANFFPPIPDKLFILLDVKTEADRELAELHAFRFFSQLKRLNDDEKFVIFSIFMNACMSNLPEDVHIDLDLLRRCTGFPISKLQRILSGIWSLGFYFRLGEAAGHPDQSVILEYHDTHNERGGNATKVAAACIRAATQGHCEQCALKVLMHLDFSNLAAVTMQQDSH